jgi:parallel beta-helix repeat protein/YD repeat-containing protein
MSKLFVVFVALSALCFLLVLIGSAQEQDARFRMQDQSQKTATLTIRSRYVSPDPPAGEHTYPTNTVITASAGSSDDNSNGSRYVCIGWRATGSPETLPLAGTEDSVTFTLTTNTVISWIWKAQYLSTTSASLGGAGVTLYSAPTADFKGTPTKGNVPLTVLFIDESIGDITFWSWNFGSGATPSTADTQGPHSVTYSTVGLKTVSLTVIGRGGSDNETKVHYIDVLPAGAPVADFFGTPRSGIASLTVQFTDRSTRDIFSWSSWFSWFSWEWDFNDGSIDSREQNPCWTYSAPGRYTVRLTVTVWGPGGGSDSETKTAYVRVCDPEHIIYVRTGGDDELGNGLSWESAFKTIQKGLDTAEDDWAVLVAKGTYVAQTSGPTIPGNVNLDFGGKAIHLKGVAAADYGHPDYDVGSIWCIDCEDISGQRAFIFQNQETEFSWVDGFTIINGNAPFGGGICCYDDSSPTIINCTIGTIGVAGAGNTATHDGGGIYACGASPTIINCTIRGNDASWDGGGIYCKFGSNLTITNCTVESNTAFFDGAGIYCLNSCPVITGCKIGSNQTVAGDGGGVYCFCCYGLYPFTVLSMVDCTIDSNSGYHGGGICCDRGGQTLLMTMDNCTIRGNVATEDGGGIWCERSDLTMSDCAITRNSAGCSGGGIACSDSGLGVSNCVIMDNTAIVAGGGIECDNDASAHITNCLIANNSTTSTTPEEGDGGGIAVYSDSDATITNCTIADNTATNNGGGIYVDDSAPMLNNTILWGNSAASLGHQIYAMYGCTVTLNYCDYANGENDVVGSVNPNSCITSDPGFVNAESRNYRLFREWPCIDAGDNSYIEGFATDLGGNPRIADGNYDDDLVVDIGAYEISNVWDTDGDGLLDPEEEFYHTDPDLCDSDDGGPDGLNDWEEIFVYGTSPLKADTDGDGYNDKWEVDHGYDPLDPRDGPNYVPPEPPPPNPPPPPPDLLSFPQHEAKYYEVPPCELAIDGGMRKPAVCETCKQRYCTIPYTGECYWWEEDAAISNPGDNSVSVIRSHRSKRNAPGAFGYNWSCNLDQHFVPEDPEDPNNYNLIWTSPCGRTFKFGSTDGVNYTPPPGFPEEVLKVQEGQNWYLRRRQKDGTIWRYQEYVEGNETKWRLMSRTDRNNNITRLEYDLAQGQGGDGNLATLDKATDMCGRSLSFTWNTEDYGIPVITQVTDPYDNTWTYNYYDNDGGPFGLPGDLESVIGPDGKTTTYTYWTQPEPSTGWEIKHNLRSVTDPRHYSYKEAFLINYYDDYDRVIQQEYGYGIILNSYTFEEVEEQGVTKDVFITWQVDRNNNVRRFKHYSGYAGGGQPAPPGSIVGNDKYGYPMGNPYILDRVETDIFCEVEGQSEPVPYTTTQYYTEDRPGSEPDYPRCALMRTKYPKGNGIIYERDNKGNITSETRREVFETSNPNTDIVKSWEYDWPPVPPWTSFSVVTRYTDELGNETNYYYDYCGDGNHNLGDSYFQTPNGNGSWDPDIPSGPHGGNLVRVVHEGVTAPNPGYPKLYPGTSQLQTVVEEYYYNSRGQLTGSLSPLGRVTAWKYYPANDPLEVQRGKLHKSWTDYGGLMLCTETTYAWESPEPLYYPLIITTKQPRDFINNAPRNPSVFYSITKQNVYGLAVQTIDAEGNTNTYQYDANNNLASTTVPNNMPLGYERDPSEPAQITTSYTYDILNHRETTTRQVTVSHSITTETEYDRKGNPIIVRQPLGNYRETVYDERDMVKVVIGRPLDMNYQREEIFYVYDENGNLIEVWDSDGYADGDIAIKEFKGRQSFHGSEPIIYEYDLFDRRTKVINEPRIKYDESSRDETVTRYNPDGTINETLAYSGSESSGVLMSRTVNTYDQLRRLVKTQNVFFKKTPTGYQCLDTWTGEPCGHTNPLGDPSLCHCVTTVNIYNEDSQLVQVVYDRDGYQPPGFSNPLVCRTYYYYDTAGRRDTVADSLDNSTTYYYDNNGNVIMTKEDEVRSSGSDTYYSHNFYDKLNRLSAAVDNMGNTRYSYYDSRGNLRYALDANSAGTIPISQLDNPWNEHDFSHGPQTVNDAAGHRTDYGYDALSRKTYTKRYLQYPSSHVLATTVWDDNSRLEKQIDANGNVTQYFYENKDRKWRIRYANSTETVILWHSSDVIYQVIDPNLATVTYDYDSLGRVINKESRPGPYSTLGRWNEYGTTFNFFTYDALGRVIFAEDNDTQTERTYDSLGNLLSETQTIGNWRGCKEEEFENPVIKIVSLRCDGSGNRLELTYPHTPGSQPAHHTEYTVDELNRVANIKFDGSLIASYDYVGPGHRILRKNLGNGTYLSFEDPNAYDGVRRPVQWHWRNSDTTTLMGFTYAYDREGNKWYERRFPKPANPSEWTTQAYDYDGIYRLTKARYGVPDGDIHLDQNNTMTSPVNWSSSYYDRETIYTMDGVGNRTKVTDNGEETDYEPNCVNQYEYVGDTHNFYDRNGNLIFDWSRVMSYDSDNRLAVATVPLEVAPDSVYNYRYDAFGRRVAQDYTFTFSGQGALKAKTYYFYDGNQILEEYSAYSDQPPPLMKAQYIYGIDGPLAARYEEGWVSYYHSNSLGSIMYSDYEYDVYGKLYYVGEPGGRGDSAAGNGNGALLGPPSPTPPPIGPTINYLFRGWDWNADTGLYNYDDVAYNPFLGRLLQRDTIGYTNLYEYDVGDGQIWYQQKEEECYCGPDITDYYVEEAKRYISLVASKLGAPDTGDRWKWMSKYAPWMDYKLRSSEFVSSEKKCPAGDECKSTVELCDKCIRLDALGNIMFGLTGALALFDKSALENISNWEQLKETLSWDTPDDVGAIRVGYRIGNAVLLNNYNALSKDKFCEVVKANDISEELKKVTDVVSAKCKDCPESAADISHTITEKGERIERKK